jgi:hypothetical protein
LSLKRLIPSLFARAVLSTFVVDRCFRIFDRLRSKAVLACAPDSFYDIYNDMVYARQDFYRAGSKTFLSSLLSFEERVISRHFPSPPATVLVGAAGGGREALALADRAFEVVAFEPARPLATSLADVRGELPIEIFVGRYEELPMVSTLTRSPVVFDLRSRPPFAAAMLGLGSFSHLRSDEHCINTLRHFGQLTRGPILLSYYPTSMPESAKSAARFAIAIGYYRTFSGAEIHALAKRAGLNVIELDEKDAWPHAVLQVVSRPAS